MNAYELADFIDGNDCEYIEYSKVSSMLRQQADRIAELEKKGEPVAWMEYIQDEEWEVWYTKPTDLPEGHSYKPLYLAPQTKPLSDDVFNKAFDYYCETDEGVLRFNYELRDEWKKEQLIRWKEAFKKASEK